jgi:RHS repeat-associated protein
VGNQRIGTYAWSGSYFTTISTNVYFGGRLIQAAGSAVPVDRLGSNVTGGKRYFPYGQEKPSATANNVEKVTGYFRDAETGLDYADQRYHQPGFGRFITPDPIGSELNHYAYVGGDPVNFVDPSGHDRCLPMGSGTETNPAFLVCWETADPALLMQERIPQEGPQHLQQCPDGFLVLNLEYCSYFTNLQTSKAASGNFTFYDINQDVPKVKVISDSLIELTKRLKGDSDCVNWLSRGGRYQGASAIFEAFIPTLNIIIVGRIEENGVNFNASYIGAVANPYEGVDIAINGQGSFFYGGNIPSANGRAVEIQGNTMAGRIFTLLHELAHVNRTAGFNSVNDRDSSANAANNDRVWENCQKVILGL